MFQQITTEWMEVGSLEYVFLAPKACQTPSNSRLFCIEQQNTALA